MGVFHVFRLYKWYQIVQSITFTFIGVKLQIWNVLKKDIASINSTKESKNNHMFLLVFFPFVSETPESLMLKKTNLFLNHVIFFIFIIACVHNFPFFTKRKQFKNYQKCFLFYLKKFKWRNYDVVNWLANSKNHFVLNHQN